MPPLKWTPHLKKHHKYINFVVKYYKNYTLLGIMKCLWILNFLFYIFYYCQIRRGRGQNGSFLVLKKPLLIHICVMVWTLFIVFSFCFRTKSIIFGDHTRPQHQETTKIVNLESLVLGVVKNHNCWFAFCVMVWVIIQCLF